MATKPEPPETLFQLKPLGSIIRQNHRTLIQLEKKYIPGLKQLEKFSHILILWGVNRFFQPKVREKVPLKRLINRQQMGLFGTRSLNRINPIALSTVPVVEVDSKAGWIDIGNFSLDDDIVIFDIKAHFPIEDRVLNPVVGSRASEPLSFISENSPLVDEIPSESDRMTDELDLSLQSIGSLEKKGSQVLIQLDEKFKDGLSHLEAFSHLRIVWCFHRFLGDRFKRTLICQPPYERAPKTGIFASRSPVRPNPIAVSTVRLEKIVQEKGQIWVSGMDAFDHTPLLDIKPYIPGHDRVETFSMPDYVAHWQKWFPEPAVEKTASPDALLPSGLEQIQTYQRQIMGESMEEFGTQRSSGFLNWFDENERFVQYTGDIQVKGARHHNLKNIDVAIPRQKLTVITGVSGCGKSTLAFDTIYAEGQRRFVSSMASGARSAITQLKKPEVDQVLGLNPVIAIEQKSVSRNPRSTVGTLTDIYDFLRVLFAKAGQRFCPDCGREIKPVSEKQVANILIRLQPDTCFNIKTITSQSDAFSKTFTSPAEPSKKNLSAFQKKLNGAVQEAYTIGNGILAISIADDPEVRVSKHIMCLWCEQVYFNLHPSLFSYNSPDGMCPECNGIGTKLSVDPSRIVTEPDKSLLDGASPWWGNLRQAKRNANWMRGELWGLADTMKIDLEQPWNKLPEEFRNKALFGTGKEKIHYAYETRGRVGEIVRPVQGAVNHIQRLFENSTSDLTPESPLFKFIRSLPCPNCEGEKLCREARFVSLAGERYPEIASLSVEKAYAWVRKLPDRLKGQSVEIAYEIVHEIESRLRFLTNVGLNYLTLDRTAPSLSGGEAQRLRLASQLGNGLGGILYILDEPSIGLHSRDNQSLIQTLHQLRDAGNTVIVVEHDLEMMQAADHIIDLGPGAGKRGGEVVATGSYKEITEQTSSLTGQYLSGKKKIDAETGGSRRVPKCWIQIKGASLHNLKNIDVRIPLNVMTCVTGVSGSGKSSLISQTLVPNLEAVLKGNDIDTRLCAQIEGAGNIRQIISVTQQPIGRSPRSNPITYVDGFEQIRRLFTQTKEAKKRKYKINRFSFNSKEGRCAACEGLGTQKIPMHFLPDVWVMCDECKGLRYSSETLEITYRGKTIADVLGMDVRTALNFFEDVPSLNNILQTLSEVGLDYINLGQSALTFSGGEAQRIKLAKELSKGETGQTLYILDEPTTGLHFNDIKKLLQVLKRLVKSGASVLVIEHHADVINAADWVIDLGPDGGDKGGYLVAEGSPDCIRNVSDSVTGQYLFT